MMHRIAYIDLKVGETVFVKVLQDDGEIRNDEGIIIWIGGKFVGVRCLNENLHILSKKKLKEWLNE